MDAGRIYREATVTGASPLALVVRLYEQIIQDLRQAIKAFEQNDIQLRTGKINHAILVIGYLESQLNFAEGGKPAETLHNFYAVLRGALIAAQVRQSKELLAQQITDVLAIREAWIAVERAESGNIGAVGKPPAAPANTAPLEWNG